MVHKVTLLKNECYCNAVRKRKAPQTTGPSAPVLVSSSMSSWWPDSTDIGRSHRIRELCKPLGTMAVRGGEQLRRSPARLRSFRMPPSFLRMQADVPQRSTLPDHASSKEHHLVPRCSDGRLSTACQSTAVSHHCPSRGSLVDLAVAAGIIPDHDGAAEAFGSMT